MRREVDFYIEMCIRRMKEFGYDEEYSRKVCELEYSKLD